MTRRVKDLCRGAFLDQRPGIEHADAVAHLGDHREVVADEQDRGCDLTAQLGYEVQHLGLHRGVEPGGRLVQDQQRRIAGQGCRNADPLLHPARELVG